MTTIPRRQLILASGAGLIASMFPTSVFGSIPHNDQTPSDDMLRFVDPQLRAPFLLHPSSVDAANLAQVRTSMKNGPPPLARPAAVARTIPGPKGGSDVRVIVVNAGAAIAAKPRPAVLYIHGGGFVAGSAAGEVAMAQQVALDHDCVVISVDYRLAPEVRFPGSLDDNYAALKWLHTHAEELGVDTGRIALMGTSAGGGHVAMLSAAAFDRGEVPVKFQLLLSPMLDDRTGSTRSVPAHIGAMMWTSTSNRFGWSSLLGVPAGSREVPTNAVPSRRVDLKGLPPTYIGVGAIDLFVAENIKYAERLVDAGVPVELNVVPGAYHVFFAVKPDADLSKAFRTSFNRALSRALQS